MLLGRRAPARDLVLAVPERGPEPHQQPAVQSRLYGAHSRAADGGIRVPGAVLESARQHHGAGTAGSGEPARAELPGRPLQANARVAAQGKWTASMRAVMKSLEARGHLLGYHSRSHSRTASATTQPHQCFSQLMTPHQLRSCQSKAATITCTAYV